MRRTQAVVVVMGVVVLWPCLAPAESSTTSCPPGAPRDIEGNCLEPARPRPQPRRQRRPRPRPRPRPEVRQSDEGQRSDEGQQRTEPEASGAAASANEPASQEQAQAEPSPEQSSGSRQLLPGPEPASVPADEGDSWGGWPWVVLGTGLAVGLTGGALHIAAYVESQRTEPFSSSQEMRAWANSVENMALAGDILLPVGAAIAVGGLIWLLLTSGDDEDEPTAAPSVQLGAAVGEGAVMIQTRGWF